PCGPLLLEESRRGNPAELQVNLVDPLFLAREPLQAFAHGAVFGDFAEVDACSGVSGHALSQCSSVGRAGCYLLECSAGGAEIQGSTNATGLSPLSLGEFTRLRNLPGPPAATTTYCLPSRPW